MSSFRDFNEDGPGTFEWDFVMGQNTTGQFPDETHYLVDGTTITEALFSYAGGFKWDISYGDTWQIENKSAINGFGRKRWFTFELDGERYKAKENSKLKVKGWDMLVDIEQV